MFGRKSHQHRTRSLGMESLETRELAANLSQFSAFRLQQMQRMQSQISHIQVSVAQDRAAASSRHLNLNWGRW